MKLNKRTHFKENWKQLIHEIEHVSYLFLSSIITASRKADLHRQVFVEKISYYECEGLEMCKPLKSLRIRVSDCDK